MEKITISTAGQKTDVVLGETLSNLKNYLPKDKKIIIVTDANIRKHYHEQIIGFPIIEIQQGENFKNIETIDAIINELVTLEADRSTFIVGIGGGIVCDITGFASSVYMRGLRFGFVSTTLLSMVDASVGGKNGVNHRGYKNMIGTFNQPEFVLCDYNILKTLDRKEFVGGFAEIIKHGAIKDISMLEYLEENNQKALSYDFEVLHRLISDSVKIKAQVVMNDEREQGERRLLNFGHTFAHSLEKSTQLSHGEAVAVGMAFASKASANLGMIGIEDAQRLIKVIEAYGLPVKTDLDPSKLFDGMKKDKKRVGGEIHLVLLENLGKAVYKSFTYSELEKIVYDLYSIN